MEFAHSLTDEERAKFHILSNPNFEVYLKETAPQKWFFRYIHGTETTELPPNENWVYKHRKQRNAQNWRKFPVSGLNIAEVQAFTSWIHKTGRLRGARLCTEFEWERGARGADARFYPHGYALSSTDANFDETYGTDGTTAGPDEVGMYPASESPFGLLDMSGSLLEWTGTYQNKNSIVVRSGSYWNPRMLSSIINRAFIDQNYRSVLTGFRLCASFEPN